MSDAVFMFGGTTVAVDVRGAPGPRGLASGPLGAESVTDEEINTAAASDILIKLGGVPLVGSGAIILDGVASSLSMPRDDANLWLVAPSMGEHALIGFKQPDRTDECAITFHMPNGGGTYYQYATIFNALIIGEDTGFTAFHGEVGPAGNDNTPLLVRYDNAIEALGGTTGTNFWQDGLTEPNVLHNFQNSYLQGWVVIGEHSQSVRSGQILEVNGTVFIGAVDGTTKQSTHGGVLAWHVGLAKFLFQSYSHATGTFQNMAIWGAAMEIGLNTSTIGFFGATPVAKPTLAAAATDAATTQTLANDIRSKLISYGLAA